MNQAEMVEAFGFLFRGRLDVYGTEEGGADRDDTESYSTRIQNHLLGVRPMGVYPMVDHPNDGWVVTWGCVDFDEGDLPSWVHAVNLQAVLHTFGITAWIERSRSKGYHVWVFLKGWTEAALVRRALLAACQIVDAPTKEINP